MARQPRLAVGTWAWVFGPYAGRPVPLETVAQEVAALGYEGVELTGRPHAHPDDQQTAAERRALTRMLADHGLTAISLGGPVGGGGVARIEREAYLSSVKRYLEYCHDSGIAALRVSTGSDSTDGRAAVTPEAAERTFGHVIDTWSAAAELAASAGVRLLWEFEPNQFASRPHDVQRVAEAIGHANFQVMFDLSHAYITSVAGGGVPRPGQPLEGGLAAFVRLLGRRIGRLHVNDTDGVVTEKGASVRRRLGDGKVDFPGLLGALGETGAGDGWWTLCLYGEADATALARESKVFMDRLKRGEPAPAVQ